MALSLGLRRFLYITALITGAAVLVVEILGAKMLAPYLGTSHFVWTAQIAVTLISLAVGYYFGGWLVDRSPLLGRLYGCILLAAIYLCAAVLAREPVAYACLHFRLALGALLISLLLFFVPLTLLATTAPFLIRMLTSSVASVGRMAGGLSALSTLGSVVGTILIGYVLIPLLPNSITMVVTAGVLMALVATYYLAWGRTAPLKPAVIAGILVGAALGYGAIKRERLHHWDYAEELYRTNSNFGMMQVLQNLSGDRRYYLNDYLTQNTYDPNERKSVSLFTYLLHDLAVAYTPKVQRVLCIGCGIGIVPMRFAREGVTTDVVEINPTVVHLASEYFNLEPKLLNLTIGDGRYYLNECRKEYDAIILDAFLGDSSPSHLLTQEAFRAMRNVLGPGGVLVINSFCDFDPARDFMAASLDKTLRKVFRSVRIHDSGTGNVFFVASADAELRFLHTPDLTYVHRSCYEGVKTTLEQVRVIHSPHGRVLTDDYNPLEFYDAANREHLRRQLAMSMRGG